MSFQAYIDNIKTKTGRTPEDFKKLAQKNGLLQPGIKAGEIVAWLKKDFELGHGHAMAIYTCLKGTKEQKLNTDEAIEKHFTNAKAVWRPVFDDLMYKINQFGDDIKISPAKSYVSILRGDRKMALVQVTAGRLDIGLKLKTAPATERFETAGTWNAMMTHRVQVTKSTQIDKELVNWLSRAYAENSPK